MSRISALAAKLLLMTVLAGGVAHAQSVPDLVQKRLKVSLNAMVREVHGAETAAAKRVVLDRFIGKIDRGTYVIERMPFLSEDNRSALASLQTRFDAYALALHGAPGTDEEREGVADSDLDAFASFMQNDLEQAQSGGVFLSTGAIIIVLLILILIL